MRGKSENAYARSGWLPTFKYVLDVSCVCVCVVCACRCGLCGALTAFCVVLRARVVAGWLRSRVLCDLQETRVPVACASVCAYLTCNRF
jgi:hypothetical protein